MYESQIISYLSLKIKREGAITPVKTKRVVAMRKTAVYRRSRRHYKAFPKDGKK